MPKFQKVSRDGDVLTFRVICADGHEETQSYMVVDETEDALMARVAVHIESERNTIPEPIAEEPLKEASVLADGTIEVSIVPEVV